MNFDGGRIDIKDFYFKGEGVQPAVRDLGNDEVTVTVTCEWYLPWHKRLPLLVAWGLDPVLIGMPCHDPPVAWEVHDHALAKAGIPVVVCPAITTGQVRILAPGGYMDPAPEMLDHEPGQIPPRRYVYGKGGHS